MIHYIELDYDSRHFLESMDDEKYQELRLTCPFLDENKKHNWNTKTLADESIIQALFDAGLPSVKLLKYKNCYITELTNGKIKSSDELNGVNHIHIPNIGLLSIRNVMVLEDACTELLQERLDDGWSIIAVCPPNACRRPTYIIGRN